MPFKIDPFKSLVFPRPIGWISSINKNGVANLAPYSYFNAVADDPPQVMFCANGSSVHSKYKDSLSNILSTKEFVVNFATSTTRNKMNNTSRDSQRNGYITTLLGRRCRFDTWEEAAFRPGRLTSPKTWEEANAKFGEFINPKIMIEIWRILHIKGTIAILI